MGELALQRHLHAFRRFFSVHRSLARGLGVIPGVQGLITHFGPYLHPGRAVPAYANAWQHGAWRRYLATSCLGTALIYRIRDFQSLMAMDWIDPQQGLALLRKEGGVALSFHHSFAYHLPAFLGAQGIPLEALALSPEESPLFPLYDAYAASWFSDTESFFCGGRWRFLHRSRSNSMRFALQALKEGRVVYSLNDFPNIYEGSKTIPVEFAGACFSVAEGLLGPALRMNRPIVVAYTRWLGGLRLAIHCRVLKSPGEPDVSSSEVVRRYFDVLAEIVGEEPEFWEAWGNVRPV